MMDRTRCFRWTCLCLIAMALLAGQAADSGNEDDAALPDEPATSQAPDSTDSTPQQGADDASQVDRPSNPATAPMPGLLSRPSALPSGLNIAVVPVEGMIYGFTLESLERRVDEAIDRGADVIVIELDTPGGLLITAREMAQYIIRIPKPTVAWVNDDAISAGALIATACSLGGTAGDIGGNLLEADGSARVAP